MIKNIFNLNNRIFHPTPKAQPYLCKGDIFTAKEYNALLHSIPATVIPLYHVDGFSGKGCNGIAFYTTRKLIECVDVLSSETVFLVDGTRPIDGVDKLVCGTCHKFISGLDVRYEKD